MDIPVKDDPHHVLTSDSANGRQVFLTPVDQFNRDTAGPAGRSVVSVTNVGQDIARVTYSDNQTKDVAIPHGQKGPPGSKGAQGQPGVIRAVAFGEVDPTGTSFPAGSFHNMPNPQPGSVYINRAEGSTWLFTGAEWVKICPIHGTEQPPDDPEPGPEEPEPEPEPDEPPFEQYTVLKLKGVRVHLPYVESHLPFMGQPTFFNMSCPNGSHAFARVEYRNIPIEWGYKFAEVHGAGDVEVTTERVSKVTWTAEAGTNTVAFVQPNVVPATDATIDGKITKIRILKSGMYQVRATSFPFCAFDLGVNLPMNFTQNSFQANPAPAHAETVNNVLTGLSMGDAGHPPVTGYLASGDVFSSGFFSPTQTKYVNLTGTRTPSSWSNGTVFFRCTGVALDCPEATLEIIRVA